MRSTLSATCDTIGTYSENKRSRKRIFSNTATYLRCRLRGPSRQRRERRTAPCVTADTLPPCFDLQATNAEEVVIHAGQRAHRQMDDNADRPVERRAEPQTDQERSDNVADESLERHAPLH